MEPTLRKDEAYTKREQDHFFGELFKRMDKQDLTLERIEAQTTKTNGRVTKLEEKTNDYEITKTRIFNMNGTIKWIIGIGITFVVLGAVIYAFVLKDISNTIEQKFTECCSAIQKKTENTSNINNTVNVK